MLLKYVEKRGKQLRCTLNKFYLECIIFTQLRRKNCSINYEIDLFVNHDSNRLKELSANGNGNMSSFGTESILVSHVFVGDGNSLRAGIRDGTLFDQNVAVVLCVGFKSALFGQSSSIAAQVTENKPGKNIKNRIIYFWGKTFMKLA